jgi:hypothetical protein
MKTFRSSFVYVIRTLFQYHNPLQHSSIRLPRHRSQCITNSSRPKSLTELSAAASIWNTNHNLDFCVDSQFVNRINDCFQKYHISSHLPIRDFIRIIRIIIVVRKQKRKQQLRPIAWRSFISRARECLLRVQNPRREGYRPPGLCLRHQLSRGVSASLRQKHWNAL